MTAGSESDTTDEDGLYEITGLVADTYDVHPDDDTYGFDPSSVEVTVNESQPDPEPVDFTAWVKYTRSLLEGGLWLLGVPATPVADDDPVLVFISWFEGGEVFRSGCTWTRGKGRIFYFRPGHEIFPIYHNPEVLQVIENAVRWASFAGNAEVDLQAANVAPLEAIDS